jgi:uncharacterized tellurite resistance protein B-like protein
MLSRITKLFRPVEPDEPGNHSHDELHIAAAMLMVEAMHLDGEASDEEIASTKAILSRHFELETADTDALFDMAWDRHEESVDLHRYTKTIKDRFSEKERIEMIELLWEVVYADGELHALESNLLRRIGGLIYVSDRDRGDARKRVLQRLGAEQEEMRKQ